MTIPSNIPKDNSGWRKTHDSETAKIWQNGNGEIITFSESFNKSSDYWKVTDTTGKITDGESCGPFETYLDALETVNTLIPQLGRDELPDEVTKIPDDEIVEIGSYTTMDNNHNCADCGDSQFVPYRVEYGDGSHEWVCPKCTEDRFDWSAEKDSTVEFTVNGSGVEGRDAIEAAQTVLHAHSDALLDAGVVDTNSLLTALHCLHEYTYGNERDDPDGLPVAHGFQRDVHELIIEYRKENPDIKWHEIRDALEELRQFAHEYAREESGKSQGRRELKQEIQDSELTPNEWFEQNTKN